MGHCYHCERVWEVVNTNSSRVHFMFSHISGNKIGWEKTGSHSEPQARGDPGDQTKVVGPRLLFSQLLVLLACDVKDCLKVKHSLSKHVISNIDTAGVEISDIGERGRES